MSLILITILAIYFAGAWITAFLYNFFSIGPLIGESGRGITWSFIWPVFWIAFLLMYIINVIFVIALSVSSAIGPTVRRSALVWLNPVKAGESARVAIESKICSKRYKTVETK